MPEKTKQLAAEVAKTANDLPANVREMAARLAETYAAGLATGMELAGVPAPADKEG